MPQGEKAGRQELYRRLGGSPNAPRDEIVAAYRRLSLLVHPDTCPDDPEAAERFRQLTEAYETLADARRRAFYDQEQARRPLNRVDSLSPVVTIRSTISAEQEDVPIRAGPVHIEPADGSGPNANRAMPWSIARLIDDWM